jgi:hypothetical protein
MLVQRKIGTYSGSQTTVVQYVSGHVNDWDISQLTVKFKEWNLKHISLQKIRI